MAKRTFWTTVGYGAGLASSLYVQRRVRRVMRLVAPPEVFGSVGARGEAIVGRVRGVGDTVAGAVREGRAAMRETEQELRGAAAHPTPRRARHHRRGSASR